jgi:hypothetical protein
MTIAEARRYAAFLSEQLRGLKVVWLLTGDDTYREEGVVPFTRELGAFLKQCDPDHRLITLHPSQQAGRLFHGCAWLDFEMVQSSHFDAYLELAHELVDEQWRLAPPKPIVNGEICFERGPGAYWGHKFDRRDVRKAFWWSVLSGALGGITYGADGVWQWKRPGETTWYPGGNEVLSWNDALALPAVQDLARARELLSRLTWWRLSPAQQRLKQRPLRHVSVSAAEDGSLLLSYLPAMPPTVGEVELDTSGLSRDAQAAWWDPETGTIRLLGGITNGCMRFTPPDERDAILMIGPSDSLQDC